MRPLLQQHRLSSAAAPDHTPCSYKRSREALLSAFPWGVHSGAHFQPADENPASPPPSSADESTPRCGRSRRTTRHVCLHQPVPTSATHSLKSSTSRSRPGPCGPRRCTGGPQGPTAYRPVGAERRPSFAIRGRRPANRAELTFVRPTQMPRRPHRTALLSGTDEGVFGVRPVGPRQDRRVWDKA